MMMKCLFLGIPCNELVVGSAPSKQQYTAAVTTAKTTRGHSAVVKARDLSYQVILILLKTQNHKLLCDVLSHFNIVKVLF